MNLRSFVLDDIYSFFYYAKPGTSSVIRTHLCALPLLAVSSMMKDPLLPGSTAVLPGASLQKACKFLVLFCVLHLSITLVYYVSSQDLKIFQYFQNQQLNTWQRTNSTSGPLVSVLAKAEQNATLEPNDPPKDVVDLADCPATSPHLGLKFEIKLNPLHNYRTILQIEGMLEMCVAGYAQSNFCVLLSLPLFHLYRIVSRGMSISRPDAVTGKCRMIRHERDEKNDPNPKRFDLIARTRQTMNSDGLNTLKYNVLKTEKFPLYSKITVDVGPLPS
ncbi:beta-1,4-galactosyltransferase 1 [Mixophyes fleayi]|uniref:beta-1,4-galactosyltransferase 1 n=1 Tax=Mixophyes fleayi TaxID=3061075 RepID=UPI003F4DA22C